jgi:hypothetical protein
MISYFFHNVKIFEADEAAKAPKEGLNTGI